MIGVGGGGMGGGGVLIVITSSSGFILLLVGDGRGIKIISEGRMVGFWRFLIGVSHLLSGQQLFTV